MNTRKHGFGAAVLVVVIAALALAGGLVFLNMKKSVPATTTTELTSSADTTPTGTLKDSSDSGLDKSTSDEESKLNALDTDAKNIDQGLSDQQGDLAE